MFYEGLNADFMDIFPHVVNFGMFNMDESVTGYVIEDLCV
jgi:hypothetical protein